jgi:hypothetical protein
VTVMAKNRTPAGRAAQRPQRPPVHTQDQLRERRRRGLTHVYGGGWSLTAEIAAICDPLARRVADAPSPARFRTHTDSTVSWLVEEVHGLVHIVVGLLARADAERRCRHLGVDERGRSIRALVDLAERPKLPEIGDEELADGTWPATLILMAQPYSAKLDALLGNAATTAVSDRLRAALTDVDAAALSLARRLDRDEAARAAKAAATPPKTQADRARDELARLGISTD